MQQDHRECIAQIRAEFGYVPVVVTPVAASNGVAVSIPGKHYHPPERDANLRISESFSFTGANVAEAAKRMLEHASLIRQGAYCNHPLCS